MNEFRKKIESSTAIIFDLGGVLLDIDINRTIVAFDNLGLSQLTQRIKNGHHTGILADLESGKIAEDEFINEVKLLSDRKISNHDIEKAWNAMLVDFPASRTAVVEELKKTKKVYLFSNTNSIHRRHFNTLAIGYKTLDDLFHRTWYSYLMKTSKPHPESFTLLLDYHSLKPETTLFIDDSAKNIEAAQKMGLQTWHLLPDNPIEKLMEE